MFNPNPVEIANEIRLAKELDIINCYMPFSHYIIYSNNPYYIQLSSYSIYIIPDNLKIDLINKALASDIRDYHKLCNIEFLYLLIDYKDILSKIYHITFVDWVLSVYPITLTKDELKSWMNKPFDINEWKQNGLTEKIGNMTKQEYLLEKSKINYRDSVQVGDIVDRTNVIEGDEDKYVHVYPDGVIQGSWHTTEWDISNVKKRWDEQHFQLITRERHIPYLAWEGNKEGLEGWLLFELPKIINNLKKIYNTDNIGKYELQLYLDQPYHKKEKHL